MDPVVHVNAVICAFKRHFPAVLDIEGTFGPLIDAVVDITLGRCFPNASIDWARDFISRNRSQLQQLASRSDADPSNPLATPAQVILPPLPPRLARGAQHRAAFDTAVTEGLAKVGMRLHALAPDPEHGLFISIWAGRDGGRAEIHERFGFPDHVIVADGPDQLRDLRQAYVAADGEDPIADAAAAVDAVAALWS